MYKRRKPLHSNLYYQRKLLLSTIPVNFKFWRFLVWNNLRKMLVNISSIPKGETLFAAESMQR